MLILPNVSSLISGQLTAGPKRDYLPVRTVRVCYGHGITACSVTIFDVIIITFVGYITLKPEDFLKIILTPVTF